MRALGCLGIALSLLSGCILLAIVAELYYFFWWKKRVAEREPDAHTSPVRDLLQLFNWKKPCPPPGVRVPAHGAAGAPRSDDEQLRLRSKDLLLKLSEEEDDTVVTELMTLAAPQRSLFTITEETQEDLEAAGVRKSRTGSKGMSLRDLLQSEETPVLTPLSSPPFFSPSTGCYKLNGVNPLFEPSWEDGSGWQWSSPPPKLKFLMAAEAKLHKKTLMDEALKGAHRPQ